MPGSTSGAAPARLRRAWYQANAASTGTAAPSRSSRARGALMAADGRKRAPASRAKAPIGRFTRKIIRQPLPMMSAAIRPPEKSGPSIADRPITGPNTPSALPISSAPNRSRISPKTCGIMTAPAAPCAALAAISSPGLAAKAHATDATMNAAMPLSSRRAQAARNDELILQAAKAVFVADPGAPITAVAKHAGVGISALYTRYGSKEELLRRLCSDGLLIVVQETEAALER